MIFSIYFAGRKMAAVIVERLRELENYLDNARACPNHRRLTIRICKLIWLRDDDNDEDRLGEEYVDCMNKIRHECLDCGAEDDLPDVEYERK